MDLADLRLVALAREHVAAGTARSLRENADLSRRDVGDVVKVSPSAVWRWENGDRKPRSRAAVLYGQLLADLAERSSEAPSA